MSLKPPSFRMLRGDEADGKPSTIRALSCVVHRLDRHTHCAPSAGRQKKPEDSVSPRKVHQGLRPHPWWTLNPSYKETWGCSQSSSRSEHLLDSRLNLDGLPDNGHWSRKEPRGLSSAIKGEGAPDTAHRSCGGRSKTSLRELIDGRELSEFFRKGHSIFVDSLTRDLCPAL